MFVIYWPLVEMKLKILFRRKIMLTTYCNVYYHTCIFHTPNRKNSWTTLTPLLLSLLLVPILYLRVKNRLWFFFLFFEVTFYYRIDVECIVEHNFHLYAKGQFAYNMFSNKQSKIYLPAVALGSCNRNRTTNIIALSLSVWTSGENDRNIQSPW